MKIRVAKYCVVNFSYKNFNSFDSEVRWQKMAALVVGLAVWTHSRQVAQFFYCSWLLQKKQDILSSKRDVAQPCKAYYELINYLILDTIKNLLKCCCFYNDSKIFCLNLTAKIKPIHRLSVLRRPKSFIKVHRKQFIFTKFRFDSSIINKGQAASVNLFTPNEWWIQNSLIISADHIQISSEVSYRLSHFWVGFLTGETRSAW